MDRLPRAAGRSPTSCSASKPPWPLARTPPLRRSTSGRAQNGCYELLQTVYPERKEKSEAGDAVAAEWIGRFPDSGGAGWRCGWG